MITASKNQLLSYEEKWLTFFEKKTKIRLPSPHSAAMNSEFTAAWRGGWSIYRRGPKTLVGAQQPVPFVHAYKYPNLSPLQAAVNSLFMVAKWEEGRRIFIFFQKRLVIFLHNLAIGF